MMNDNAETASSAQPATALPGSLCALPWIHLATTVDGVWGRCCFDSTNDYDHYYSQADEPVFRLVPEALGCTPASRYARDNPDRVMGVDEAFNSPNLRRTRLEMLAGERPASCRACYQQEDLGVESHRVDMNRRFAAEVDLATLTAATGDDGSLDAVPIYLDLRLGNTCNLACIMCSFPVSSRIGATAAPRWLTASINPFREDEQLWTWLKENGHSLRYLYLAGGEPFLQADHARLIALLVSTGAAAGIDLYYNSNLTVLHREGLMPLTRFRSALIAASCDGVGELFSRIRVGGAWDQFVANLRTAKDYATVWLDVTVQRDNVQALGDIMAFADAEGVEPRFQNILQYPEDLSIRALPDHDKELAARRLAELTAACDRAGRADLVRQLSRVRSYLLS